MKMVLLYGRPAQRLDGIAWKKVTYYTSNECLGVRWYRNFMR